MAINKEKIEQSCSTSVPRFSDLESRRMSAEVIDRLINLRPMDPNYPLAHSFENIYSASNDYETKFIIARSLIEDERYLKKPGVDPTFLIKRFIPSGVVSEEEAKDQQDKEAIEKVGELKDKLQLMLVEKGHIGYGTREDEEAQGVVARELERRVETRDLIEAGWPIEVVGQIMTVELFAQVSDTKKLEELRSWVTRALMRPYLGVLKGTTPTKEMNIVDMMDRVPKKIFKDEYTVRYNLVQRYLEQRLSRVVTDEGLAQGLVEIERLVGECQDPEKKRFLQQTYNRFYDIATFPLVGNFKNRILVKGQEREFPSFEQRTFVYDYINHNTRLLAADTGLGKTGAAYLAMENTSASRVLVLVPANGRETWEIEANVVFNDPDKVFIVKGSADLEKAAESGKKYIVLSQDLLEGVENDPNLMELLENTLVNKAQVDGLIIDEVDNLSKYGAISTKAAVRLASLINRNHQQKTGQETTQVAELSATPIRSKLSDLNVLMAIPYPQEYVASHDQSTAYKKTFSDAHLNRPDLVYSSLTGEKRMYRWEQATGVQEFRYQPLHMEASPFEEYLCYFIASEVETGALNKIRLLEDALLNPLLVKVEIRTLIPKRIPSLDIDEALNELKLIAREWKKFRGVEVPSDRNDFLSVDVLVKLGKGDLVLSCFFSDLLEDGIDTLVEELTKDSEDPDIIALRNFWLNREISTKYRVLREQVESSLAWRKTEDGRLVRDKVFIISPSKRQGRTGDVLQRAIKNGDGTETSLYTKYELNKINDSKLLTLIKSWTGEFCSPEDILMIDGTVSLGRQRDAIISSWVNNPNAVVMLATLESTYQSRDYTLNNLVDSHGREIAGVKKIFLSPPWHFQQLKQMIGRSQRQGQLVPVENIVLEVQDLIDQGKGEAVVFSYLLSRMALAGMVLTPQDQAFFDSKRLGNRIEIQSKEARYLRDSLSIMTGAGEERLLELFESNLVSPEKFAEKFYDEARDEYHITGYNAGLVSYLIKHTTVPDSKVLSIGAGTLLLQRKLQRGIDNLDINPFAMEEGWEKAKIYGGDRIQGRASALNEERFADGTYDFVDLAFTLHMSRLKNGTLKPDDSERVKILKQINRVLKVGGYFSLTTPEGSFDDQKFEKFSKAMEQHFGFKINQEYSGWSFGIGKPRVRKRLGWSIFMTKVGDVNLEWLNISDLEFLTDSREWRSEGSSKHGKSSMLPQDYPSAELRVDFKEFEIVNPNNISEKMLITDATMSSKHIISQGGKEEKTELITSEEPLLPTDDIGLNFLRGKSKQDYKDYRLNLIRPISRITGWGWVEIETFCIRTMQNLSLQEKFTNSRLTMFSQIIKEARKEMTNGHGEVS